MDFDANDAGPKAVADEAIEGDAGYKYQQEISQMVCGCY